MKYTQITPEERYMLSRLRTQGLGLTEIATVMGRHRSTIWRELNRNTCVYDGCYRPSKAQERTNGRRSRSRRNRRFTPEQLALVERRLAEKWSPEQISGRLIRSHALSISHETIYRHVWRDKSLGGTLYTHLRCAQKRRRKRYGTRENRGRLAAPGSGDRPQAVRPLGNRHRHGRYRQGLRAHPG